MNTEGPQTSDAFAGLKRSVVGHYEGSLAAFGPTARGMDWKDEASQRMRFAALCAVADLEGRSVHDVGAGAGHLYAYLRERGIGARYLGSDLSERMVAAASALHPEASFERRDILRDRDVPPAEIVLTSGLFHVKLGQEDEAWTGFVRTMVRRMYELCTFGIAFNLMTDQVDFRDPNLHYSDPRETLEFCRRELSRHVALRHDYALHEYTVYVYRQPSL